jgi:2-hydroxy-3-keto-5-methylthiopentenyl-1-phosphate phosphatase
MDPEATIALYDKEVNITKDLMMNKNHDYGEAWRDMRVSSFTDLILMKLLRIKQIEDNEGKTLVSEGIDSGYRDMINYSVFALIKLVVENQES